MRIVVDLPQPEGPTRTMNSLVMHGEVKVLHREHAVLGNLEVVLLLLGLLLLPKKPFFLDSLLGYTF